MKINASTVMHFSNASEHACAMHMHAGVNEPLKRHVALF